MNQLNFRKLDVLTGRPMSRSSRPLSTIIFMGIAALAITCSEPEQNSIVGDWSVEITGINDFGYSAVWQIKTDETYRLDFTSITIDGEVSGYASGVYRALSDSILEGTSIAHEMLESNKLFRRTVDTLFTEVNGSELIASRAMISDSTQFARFGLILTWVRQ